jgi:hypothetical protein
MSFSRRRPAVDAAALALVFLVASGGSAHAAETWPTDGDETGSTVTVVQPADQIVTVGDPIIPIRVEATDSDASRILVYTATGLPAGLSMSSVVGAVSGTPTEVGTSNATVTVSDGTGPASTTSFTWTVAPKRAVPKPADGDTYTIGLAGTTNEIDNAEASATSGQRLIVRDRNSADRLAWAALLNADGSYSFRDQTSRLCLDVEDPSSAVGTAVIQASCSSARRQNWVLIASGAGFELVNASSGLAIGCTDAADRAPLTQQESGSVWEFARAGS